MTKQLTFYANRSTPRVSGGKSKHRPEEGRVVKTRPATAAEEKTIARGDWVRTRADGKKPGEAGAKSSGLKGRPKLKGK